MNILSIITLTPLIAGILIACSAIFVPRKEISDNIVKWFSLVVSIFSFILTIVVYFKINPNIAFDPKKADAGMQLVEHYVWIKSLNITYYVGVDGMSVLMLILTGFVSVVGVLASWNIKEKLRGYFSLYLILLAAMYGVFVSLDFFLFYVFWEIMLLPMYFLIAIWGGPRKEYAAIKFFIYTLAGSVFMLVGLIALYYNMDGVSTFSLIDMMRNADHYASLTFLGLPFDKVIWIFLFLGFAIKIPMFPFHTWLPDAHVQAPTPISIILAGVLLKMGTYGILRLNYTIFPNATLWASGTIALFGVINIVYGALVAMAQKDLKKLIAYSSVSHMGYVMLGMGGLTAIGMNGAVLQMFSHGIITSMLFMLVGVVYDRAHHREINKFGGIAKIMPAYAAFAGIAWFAALGLPGFSGFIAEALVFVGAFPIFRTMTIIAVLSVILTAAYMLWSYQRVFFGKIKEDMAEKYHYHSFKDLSLRELLVLVPLSLVTIVVGFYPNSVLSLINVSLESLVKYVIG